MLRAVADRGVDLRALCGMAPANFAAGGLGCVQRDAVDESRRPAGRPPPSPARHRRGHADERLRAAASSLGVVAQLRQAGTTQQHAQRRIAERRLVELGQMRIAAGHVPDKTGSQTS